MGSSLWRIALGIVNSKRLRDDAAALLAVTLKNVL
jgi:hypothetical protein